MVDVRFVDWQRRRSFAVVTQVTGSRLRCDGRQPSKTRSTRSAPAVIAGRLPHPLGSSKRLCPSAPWWRWQKWDSGQRGVPLMQVCGIAGSLQRIHGAGLFVLAVALTAPTARAHRLGHAFAEFDHLCAVFHLPDLSRCGCTARACGHRRQARRGSSRRWPRSTSPRRVAHTRARPVDTLHPNNRARMTGRCAASQSQRISSCSSVSAVRPPARSARPIRFPRRP
jgi:hypothetical protein